MKLFDSRKCDFHQHQPSAEPYNLMMNLPSILWSTPFEWENQIFINCYPSSAASSPSSLSLHSAVTIKVNYYFDIAAAAAAFILFLPGPPTDFLFLL